MGESGLSKKVIYLWLEKKQTDGQLSFDFCLKFTMRSRYAVYIFKLLQSRMMSETVPKNGMHIVISVDELRECCACKDKYPTFGNFKNKVIDKAMDEINRVSMYDLTYTFQKNGRTVKAIDFFIVSKWDE